VIELFEQAKLLQEFCEHQGWRSCFIGGIALQRWGEPRLTVDADLSLFTGFGQEERFIDTLLGHFQPRIPDAKAFALRNRVLLLRSPAGIGYDVALAGLPFEEGVVHRATSFLFLPDISLVTCSAEDLIVLKAFANRGQDRIDIEGVVRRQGAGLDWRAIVERLTPLVEVKEEPEILDFVAALRARRKG
jgi:hypothetical protein